MKRTLIALLFVSAMQAAHAGDLLDSLRQLRGTMDEVTRTSRELNDMKNAVAPGSTQDARPSQQAQQPQPAVNAANALQAGDVLMGKVANIKVYRDANKQSAALAQVSRSEELIYMGEEQNGLYKVTTASGEGWVDKLLVRKN